jgi:hypothetical protein
MEKEHLPFLRAKFTLVIGSQERCMEEALTTKMV